MYEFTPVGWLKHCVFHPVEGFEVRDGRNKAQ